MAAEGRTIFVCSCEDTMPLDGRALARGCRAGDTLRTAEQLCRGQLQRFLAAMGEGRAVTVGCTQEAPLFGQEAEAAGFDAGLVFANVRERAGWSDEAAETGPKMAALLAAAAVPMPEVPLVPLKSGGVTLILGRDAVALEAAERLKAKLDLTVLLTGAEPVQPLRAAEYPVLKGRARSATGWLGAFEVVVDGTAAPAPSSRAAYVWGPAKDGAVSRCDILLDLSGGAPLFPAHAVRQGYVRADPGDAVAVERAIAAAAELVGTFDQPRFVTFDAGLCAHSRNRRTGCTRCLELCPTGAITPGKDSVVVSAEICAGCGACATVCPTGAAQYALPPTDALLRRLRVLLLTYAQAGGSDAVVLLHDGAQGEALLDALARQGDGLPARVLPLAVNETSSVDPAVLAAVLCWGAQAVRVLLPGRRGHGAEGLFRGLELVGAVLAGLGLEGAAPRVAAIETDDPFTLGEELRALPRMPMRAVADAFLPQGAPREILRIALRALQRAAPAPAEVVTLPRLAPFGEARVEAGGCTLCLACTMVCPTGALGANPDRPQLSFLEDACVQCGLCVATCPEKVIALVPRLDFSAAASQRVVVKEEEPAACPRCGKLFGTRSSVDAVKRKLVASGHWMFADPARLAVLDLCEDCRVAEATLGGLDPYAGPARPVTKTTEDWLREAEREKAKRDAEP